MIFKEYDVTVTFGNPPITITNCIRECPSCSVESNTVEWNWRGVPSDAGYKTYEKCPSCKVEFETVEEKI